MFKLQRISIFPIDFSLIYLLLLSFSAWPSQLTAAPADVIHFGISPEASQRAAYYLNADSQYPNTGPTDELKRTPRQFLFWRNLFNNNLFDDGEYDCNCNNYAGDGNQGYNQQPPLPPPPALPWPQWRPLPPWRPLWRPFQPFFGAGNCNRCSNYGGGPDNYGRGPPLLPPPPPPAGAYNNGYAGNGNNNLSPPSTDYENRQPSSEAGYDNGPTSNYDSGPAPAAPSYDNDSAAPTKYDSYASPAKPTSSYDSYPAAPSSSSKYDSSNSADSYGKSEETNKQDYGQSKAAVDSYADSKDTTSSYDSTSPATEYKSESYGSKTQSSSTYGQAGKSPQILYQPIIYVSPQYQQSKSSATASSDYPANQVKQDAYEESKEESYDKPAAPQYESTEYNKEESTKPAEPESTKSYDESQPGYTTPTQPSSYVAPSVVPSAAPIASNYIQPCPMLPSSYMNPLYPIAAYIPVYNPYSHCAPLAPPAAAAPPSVSSVSNIYTYISPQQGGGYGAVTSNYPLPSSSSAPSSTNYPLPSPTSNYPTTSSSSTAYPASPCSSSSTEPTKYSLFSSASGNPTAQSDNYQASSYPASAPAPLQLTMQDQPYRACPELFTDYNKQLNKISNGYALPSSAGIGNALSGSGSGSAGNTFINAQLIGF